MKTLALALFIFTATNAFARALNIPELQPGTSSYEYTRSTINKAAADPSYGYQKGAFHTVQTETAFLTVNNGLIAMPLQVNGKYFWVPLDFDYVDNWSTFARRHGPRPAIFLIQRGHRLDPVTQILYRIVATIRLSKHDGTVFPQLEYSETATVEPCPECIK